METDNFKTLMENIIENPGQIFDEPNHPGEGGKKLQTF